VNGSVAHVQHRGIFVRNAAGKAVRAIGAMIDKTETLDRMQKIESQNKVLKDIAWIQSHRVLFLLIIQLKLKSTYMKLDPIIISQKNT
jgi:hypothetical protein